MADEIKFVRIAGPGKGRLCLEACHLAMAHGYLPGEFAMMQCVFVPGTLDRATMTRLTDGLKKFTWIVMTSGTRVAGFLIYAVFAPWASSIGRFFVAPDHRQHCGALFDRWRLESLRDGCTTLVANEAPDVATLRVFIEHGQLRVQPLTVELATESGHSVKCVAERVDDLRALLRHDTMFAPKMHAALILAEAAVVKNIAAAAAAEAFVLQCDPTDTTAQATFAARHAAAILDPANNLVCLCRTIAA